MTTVLPCYGLPAKAATLIAQALLRDYSEWEIGVGDGDAPYERGQNDLVGTQRCWKRVDAGYPIVQGGALKAVATFEPDEANFEQRERALRAKHAQTGEVVLLARVPGDFGRKARGLWYAEIELVL